MGRVRLVENPDARGVAAERVPAAARDFHRSLPGYAPSRLVAAPAAAAELGVAHVWVKDESERLGLPSFKILGASWACYRALCARAGLAPEPVRPLAELAQRLPPLTLIAATDGNHGRAVARMAKLLGLAAHILVPVDMAEPRREAIAAEGARVTVIHGSYDEAVARSAALAGEGALVISDTSWPGYEDVPAWVIDGYGTIGAELDEQLAPAPDLVAVQIGVGAFAAAMVRHFRRDGVRIVGVEPARADCVTASIEAGHPVEIPGPQDSIMAGLNCGTPSLIAFPVLRAGIELFAVVDDERAREAMRLLARDGIVAGESGAAGLAGLLELRHAAPPPHPDHPTLTELRHAAPPPHPDHPTLTMSRERLGLRPDATVLLVCTEGATDPGAYAAAVRAF